MAGHTRNGTPGESLNVILGVPPLDLHIEAEVLKARLRLDGKSYGKTNGHILHADNELNKAGITNNKQTDNIDREIIWENKIQNRTGQPKDRS